MIRPAASVAHVLAAVAAGMLAGGTTQTCARLLGGGPEDLTHGLALLGLVLGLPRHRYPPPPSRWVLAPLLFLPAALVVFADSLRHGLVKAIVPLGGAGVGLGWLEGALFGLCLLPLAGTLRIALRGQRRLGAVWAAVGLAITVGLSPGWTLTAAAVLALIADRVPAPHRAWAASRPGSPLTRALCVGLAVAAITLAWTALRGVVDPTPGGALLCIGATLTGAAIGRWVSPRAGPGAICWTLGIVTLMLALVGAGSVLTDRIGSAAAAWEWGIDGRVWLSSPLAITGLLGGLAMGRAPAADRATAWAVTVGLLLGPWALGSGSALIALGVLGGIAALSLGSLKVRLSGALVTAACVVLTTSDMVPSPGRMGPGIYDSMRSTTQWAEVMKKGHARIRRGWMPEGSIGLETSPPDTRSQDARLAAHVELDGLDLRVPSGAAAAEELSGHLAALLSPDPTQLVVLGDATGEVVRGLGAHPATAVNVAVPFPGLIRMLADADPIRRESWLDPHVHLQALTPQRRLAATRQASGIVELSRTPWAHGGSGGLTLDHLKAVHRRLGEKGIYVLCTHLSWWPDGGPAALARQMEEVFGTVQVWLPPTGADSLIWVASDSPVPLKRLSQRFSQASGALERLGYGTPAGLAGTAIAGTTGVREWGEHGTQLPSPDFLGPTLFSRPVFHAAGLSGDATTAAGIWDVTDAEELLTEVDQVLMARRMFVALIDDAQRGQIGSAFDTARALVRDHGEVGARTLEPLIDPHIADAEAALRTALSEGSTSTGWAEARRYATTARMIAPQSPRPYVLLAEVALGQGDVPKAEAQFRTALGYDPKYLRALDGLARCGRLKGDVAQVEQALRASTRHGPRDGRTWHNLGIFMLEQGRHDEAIEALETAASLAPKDEPQMLAGALNGMAKVYLAKGEATGALVRAERATRLDEDNAVSWYLRGRAHYELERYDEAEQDFRKAVLTDGSLVEARGAIGQVRAIRGDFSAAAEQFRAVLRLDPNNVPARENLRRLAPLLPKTETQEP